MFITKMRYILSNENMIFLSDDDSPSEYLNSSLLEYYLMWKIRYKKFKFFNSAGLGCEMAAIAVTTNPKDWTIFHKLNLYEYICGVKIAGKYSTKHGSYHFGDNGDIDKFFTNIAKAMGFDVNKYVECQVVTSQTLGKRNKIVDETCERIWSIN